jgi:hypothetical protein
MRWQWLVSLSLALGIAPAASVDVAAVWSAHPAGFQLLTHGGRQFVAFYDAGRHMTVATRTLGSTKWQFHRLASDLGWDSHNSVTMAVDREGYLHLAGNMHAAPLVYFRTAKPLDIASFERVASMVGGNETRCTYPQWLRSPAGELIFTYRDGRSGAGDQIYNVYSEKTRTWRRLLNQPLTTGHGRMNAYFHGPVQGPDGWFHLVWTWRDTPDCATNHDLSYARSRDLIHWETSAGKPLTLPIGIETAEIVDPVPVHGGMINGNTRIGFDSERRVIVTYHKFDAKGATQIVNARREAAGWRLYQATDWQYRWDFQGGGSIPFEIAHGAVRTAPGGRLRLDYRHPQAGSGTWELDEATLRIVGQAPPGPEWPAALRQVESDFPGMTVHMVGDSGQPPAGVRYALRWETLEQNRDRPRQPPLPAPSMLRVYEMQIPAPANTAGHFGVLKLDRSRYAPLDRVKVTIEGRARGDAKCIVRVADSAQRQYFEREIALTGNRGEVEFTAVGALGAHYVYLWFPDERRHSRYLNFQVDAETSIRSGDRDFDLIYPFTRERMPLGRREYQTPRGKFVGYISADTNHFDGIWLRDWIHGAGAFRWWERDLQGSLDRFLEMQKPDGQIPDGIERDGRTWRVGLESDVEYIATLGVWQTWQATGDDAWLRTALPRLEKAMAYIMSDPKHWDAKHRLIQRQHSCDTWDYDIDGASDKGNSRHVLATCDQSGYALAFHALSAMYRHLGDTAAAERWAREAEGYRQRAVALLWDGTKFQHHLHLDPSIEHGDFDESQQLAMGNTWAMTRGLASPAQAQKIVDEYRRRQRVTGDAYPWWSLQPGYPDRLHYWTDTYRLQGAYANGGLMPWVGGELCRAAFWFGREAYAVALLRQYADHLRRTGGAQVWYYPDGTPGHRTQNEVDYAGWGMAQWVDALIEGAAGIRDTEGQLRAVELTPRWAAAGIREVRATVRYPVTNAYFAYHLKQIGDAVELEYTGSSAPKSIRVLLPKGYVEAPGPLAASGSLTLR